MIWANSINELQYYNQPPAPAPCYCEHLVYPGDLLLQGSFPSSATSGFTLEVDVYTPDGLTVLEASATALPKFSYYFFNYNGTRYFNLRLNSYSTAMCANPCWILRVRVTVASQVVFDKYTQRYCQANCCDTPRGIRYQLEDVAEESQALSVSSSVPLGNCNKPLIRIEVTFPCLDSQLGDFYGIPTTVYSGSATFSYKKITNIVGKIAQKPREITREISFNCNLQRAESFKPWLLESTTWDSPFPAWKMNELESMFHAPEIIVSDFYNSWSFQFAGGVICEQIYKCWELFKLKATLQTCTVRQTFGCNEECEPTNAMEFLIPQNATGSYYTENNELVGDFDGLLNWYRGQTGITSATDTSGEYENTAGSFIVEGSGYIPTFFYFNNISPRNRVYGTTTPVAPVINCDMPVLGTIIVEDDICAVPVLGTIIVEAEEEDIAAINNYGDWIVSEDSNAVIAGGVGRINLNSQNSTLPSSTTHIDSWETILADTNTDEITVPDGNVIALTYAGTTYVRTTDFTQAGNIVTMINGVTFAIGDEVLVGMQTSSQPLLFNEIIGVIAPNGWPGSNYQVTIGDIIISIDTSGNIYYSGYPTTTDGAGSEIEIINLNYPL